LLWKRTFSSRKQTWDDPLNLDLMPYDRVFEPIVLDGRMFVGFNDRDKLAAFDTETGEECWSFFTDAPVRLPPAGWNGLVYFCSDDGFLYCVNATDGKLEWRFRGGPSAQQAIGNQRFTSAWPARGGPVVRDGTVYFAASIWPFMGTFIYALDADTGRLQWVNDSTGSQYIKQPHSADSFAGVAPQGALVATDELLLVPGGRSVPAAFDRRNGKLRYFEINAGGKGTGGSFVAADQRHFYVHTRQDGTRAFNLADGVKTAFMPNEPVLAGGFAYAAEAVEERPVVRAYGPDQKVAWEIDADGRGDLILAGDHLYAAGATQLAAIRLPHSDQPARVSWSIPVDGQVDRLLAADGKLFAVTLAGEILAFGPGTAAAPQTLSEGTQSLEVSPASAERAARLLAAGDAAGYSLWFGVSEVDLAEALASQSPFVQLAFVEENGDLVERLRQRLDAAGLYGGATVHQSPADQFMAPKYVANLVFVGRELAASAEGAWLAKLYESVRPYGGVLHLLAEERHRAEIARRVVDLKLEQAQVETTVEGVLVRRVGALPGSADWTHQHGDIANTIKSDDQRVRLPLGILWFGGSSHLDVLPRHGHGPPEQVVGGRLFVEGMNSLSARDVYTGRVLWKREFPNLGTLDVYYDATYEDTPLDTRYNQVHIPGANGRGTNYVATDDRVYLLEGDLCHVLDPASGETLRDIQLPPDDSGGQRAWGYIGVYQDVLIGGLGFAMYRTRHDLTFESDKELRSSRAGFGSKSLDRAASIGLVGFDRFTGKPLWTVKALHSFWHNGIVAGGGKIFCLDKNPAPVEDALRRRGKSPPDNYRLVAFDYRTGQPQWQVSEGIFGTWLGYSEEQDLLLQAGAAASDRLSAEVAQGMAVYSGQNGRVRWRNDSLKYAGPCILHNDWIITNANSYAESAGAFRLDNGEQKLVANPLTGALQPWKITRTYGCNNVIASEHLLTFRSGAAGFYELANDSGTGNFGGFKSGCTSNLVVANGVLNAPDYTRTCSCAYQNQTSLALVHMPELEFWTVHPAVAAESASKIQRLDLNFGAPGDRRDEDGTLWLEYPPASGASPPLSVEFSPEASFFRHHASSMTGAALPWVLASGVEGATEIRVRLSLANEQGLQAGVAVNHAEDDAEENERGEVSLDSGDLELVEDSGSQLVGLRFNKISLARGAAVRSAYLQFTCDEPSSAPTSLIIAAQDSGHAERFDDASHDLSARPRTTAEVGWHPPAWPTVGAAAAAQRTPDLTPLLRSVVNRSDWQPGNSVVFLISGSGKRVAAAFSGRGGNSAKLIVDADETAGGRASSQAATPHRIRLFFAAPPALGDGKRVFDVYLQGQRVIQDLTLDPATPGRSASAIHAFEGVMVTDELSVRLAPQEGQPVLSGIELIRMASD